MNSYLDKNPYYGYYATPRPSLSNPSYHEHLYYKMVDEYSDRVIPWSDMLRKIEDEWDANCWKASRDHNAEGIAVAAAICTFGLILIPMAIVGLKENMENSRIQDERRRLITQTFHQRFNELEEERRKSLPNNGRPTFYSMWI